MWDGIAVTLGIASFLKRLQRQTMWQLTLLSSSDDQLVMLTAFVASIFHINPLNTNLGALYNV